MKDPLHQSVLDDAWRWLRDTCGWWCRTAVDDERAAQLWVWNRYGGAPR